MKQIYDHKKGTSVLVPLDAEDIAEQKVLEDEQAEKEAKKADPVEAAKILEQKLGMTIEQINAALKSKDTL